MLPYLELISAISMLNNQEAVLQLDSTVNEYLKLIIQVLSGRSYVQYEQDHDHFFTMFFFLLSKLPLTAVNS